jgi:hypothetical protein
VASYRAIRSRSGSYLRGGHREQPHGGNLADEQPCERGDDPGLREGNCPPDREEAVQRTEPADAERLLPPAALVEDSVLHEVADARLPEDAIAAARAMLKERISKPADDAAQTKRRRLEKALEALRKQHACGDLTDDDYRAERREFEAAVAALPARSTDTLVAFDEARTRLLSMPEAIAAASPDRRAERHDPLAYYVA